jgi:H+/Cl- antiporter ClcA
VVLAVEVVLIEYTVGGFTPVLLAAVSGATLGRFVYGSQPAFAVPQVVFGSLWELPWVAAMGAALGCYSAGFIALVRVVLARTASAPWWLAFIGAAVAAGAIASFVPQVMGVGYDVIERMLEGRFAGTTLAAIAAMKLVATAAGVGARVPAGVIGPTFVMGCAFGGMFGVAGAWLVTSPVSNVAFYAMLGMAGMMGATLNAPLSAVVAVLELTGNSEVILPGILTVMMATLIARHVFHCESIFAVQLAAAGPALHRAHQEVRR